MTANANGGLISNAALQGGNQGHCLHIQYKCACGMFLYGKLLFVIEGIIACLGWGKLFCAPLNGTKVAPQPNILPSLADFGY